MQKLCNFMDRIKMYKLQMFMKLSELKLYFIYTKLYNAVYFLRHKEFVEIWACIDK